MQPIVPACPGPQFVLLVTALCTSRLRTKDSLSPFARLDLGAYRFVFLFLIKGGEC